MSRSDPIDLIDYRAIRPILVNYVDNFGRNLVGVVGESSSDKNIFLIAPTFTRRLISGLGAADPIFVTVIGTAYRRFRHLCAGLKPECALYRPRSRLDSARRGLLLDNNLYTLS
jgi:hypothetical protein